MSSQKIAFKIGGLLLGMSITFTACKGQVKPDHSHESPIDREVSALDEAIWSIYQDQREQYWFGSNGQGVFYFNGATLTQFTTKDGLVGNQIRGIQGDQFGNVYFDTPDGVGKYDGHRFSVLKAVYSPENQWMSEPDDLWFKGSGDSNGVYRYDGRSLFHLEFPKQDLRKAYGLDLEKRPYSPYGVYGIYKDQKGNLWFGTLSAGVFRFDGESLFWIAEKELTVLDDGRVPGVRSMIEDKDGNFWLSNILSRYVISESAEGVVAYEKLEGIKQAAGETEIRLPYFMSALTDREKGDLWMLSYAEGVWRYDGKKLVQYSIKDGETDVLLYAMYQDKQGTIWLGTHNAGVYTFDGSSFEKFKPTQQ